MKSVKSLLSEARGSDLIKVTKTLQHSAKISTIDYNLYTGPSMPTGYIDDVPADDRFDFEKELLDAVNKVFKKYKNKF